MPLEFKTFKQSVKIKKKPSFEGFLKNIFYFFRPLAIGDLATSPFLSIKYK